MSRVKSMKRITKRLRTRPESSRVSFHTIQSDDCGRAIKHTSFIVTANRNIRLLYTSQSFFFFRFF